MDRKNKLYLLLDKREVDGEAAAVYFNAQLRREGQKAVAVSAAEGMGLLRLLEAIQEELSALMVDITVEIPYAAATMIELFRRYGAISKQEYKQTATLVKGKIPQHLVPRFRVYQVRRR